MDTGLFYCKGWKTPTGEGHIRQRQARLFPCLQENCSFRFHPGGGHFRKKQVASRTMVELHI